MARSPHTPLCPPAILPAPTIPPHPTHARCGANITNGNLNSEQFALFTPDLLPGKAIPWNCPVVLKSLALNKFGRVVSAVISTAPRMLEKFAVTNQQSAPMMAIKFDLDTVSGASVFNMTLDGLLFNGNPGMAVANVCPAPVSFNIKQGDLLSWTPGARPAAAAPPARAPPCPAPLPAARLAPLLGVP
jgi:hypothetical protein